MSARKSPIRHLPFKKLGSYLGIALLLIGSHAQAMDIELTDIGSTPMTNAQLAAFEKAAEYWENLFWDAITVEVAIAWKPPGEFSSGVAAHVNSAKTTHSLSDVRLALITDAFFQAEKERHAQLIDPLPIKDIYGLRTVSKVTMTNANAKALGLTPENSIENEFDAVIEFNLENEADYDLDQADGIDAGKIDFVSLAAHELGHVLGFTSSTDNQDSNYGTTIYPTTLDLMRYKLTGNAHNDVFEPRMMTRGPAEFYNGNHSIAGIKTNIPFSQGLLSYADSLCNNPSGSCSASHWRDDQNNLMDPSIAPGSKVDATAEDIRAMDYIGYYRFHPLLFELVNFPIWWSSLWLMDVGCSSCSDAIVRNNLRDFPPPPKLENVTPPFRGANIAMHFGMKSQAKGFEKRSATGYARFEAATENPHADRTIRTRHDHPGQWEHISLVEETMDVLPPRLTEFYLESDSENGSPFSFRATIPTSGLLFNSSLGDYGGFRVSGFVDGFDDGERGDADANMTLELLMDASGNIDRGPDGLSFSIDASKIDNEIKLHDFKAFGLTEPTGGRQR